VPPGPSGAGSSGAGSPAPDVTVVVVTWQGRHLIEACLDSLSTQTAAHRVVVVDNASTDGTTELVRDRHPEVALVELATNTGFAGGVAAVLDQVETRYLALLNNDAEADPTWLREATAYLGAHPEVAAVSSRMLLSDVAGTINNAGVLLLPTGYGADRGLGEPDGETFDQPVEVFAASGGAGVYRTLAVKAVGGIEPRYFMYYEDTDLSWRLRLAGWTIAYCPTAVVHHRHAASSAPGSPSFAFHTERNRLLTLARTAEGLVGPKLDRKLAKLIAELKGLLADGYDPIVFCRFIDTADYVADHLASPRVLGAEVNVTAVTGRLPPELVGADATMAG